MTNSIFLTSLWQRRRAWPLWMLGAALTSWMVVALYPSLGSQDAYAQLANNLPPALEPFFGELADLGTLNGFLNAELFSFMLPLIMIIASIGIGAHILNREEQDGTLELLLASPISRSRILLEKILAVVVYTLAIALAGWAGIAVGSLTAGVGVNHGNTLAAVVNVWLLGLVFGGLAFLAGSAYNFRSFGTGLATVVAVAGYLSNALADLAGWLKPFRAVSPFKFYASKASLDSGMQVFEVSILLGTVIIFFVLSLVAFQRRDIGT